MPNRRVNEEPVQFGQGGRLFGMLTRPAMPIDTARQLPVFVFLNAGLLHRVGPYGLYVRLARRLAGMGFSSLRVDLAGKGDSPARSALTQSQSLAVDCKETIELLESRLGPSKLVLAGLCSGADDAIRCATMDERIVGMLLMDPVCAPDDGFRARAMLMKFTNTKRYLVWFKRRMNLLRTRPTGTEVATEVLDSLALRGSPSQQELRAAFRAICGRRGRVMSVFTEYAVRYYNQQGQLGRDLNVAGYDDLCTEVFWPHSGHTFAHELHRRRLIEECETWAAGFLAQPATKSRSLPATRGVTNRSIHATRDEVGQHGRDRFAVDSQWG